MYPSIACLCPTYGRPRLLANAITCFLAQDYPSNRCKLVISDDLGTIRGLDINGSKDLAIPGYDGEMTLNVENVIIHSRPKRFNSLPEKYNDLWRIAPVSDIYLVWEDDDCQLPWCLSAHAKACEHHGWSYPSHVWSDYGDAGYPIPLRLHTEPTGGRFHGCLGIRGDTLQAIGGWPETRQANFDQQLIGRLRESGEPGDPLSFCPPYDMTREQRVLSGQFSLPALPPYIFRWHTGQRHGQSDMEGPNDESWYDRYQPPDRTGQQVIVPAFDEDTKEFYRLLTTSHANL